ncbi:MAG: electron transfer flavoprotein subunit beta/FixA family protein [Phycisphaerae bacterium]
MRIVVPIKQVPETNAVKMDPETGTMIREGVDAIVNPLDLYAIEAALRLREAHGGEIIAISMGPPRAESALREAISMGCDGGVLASGREFAGSDTWATSYALAAVVRKLGEVDLVLCGERATDGDTGQVGPGIAAFLDWPIVSYVSEFSAVAGSTARVHRLVEAGHEVLDVDLPAVMTVIKEIGDPRLPTLRGKQHSRAVDVPAWGADELGVDAEELGLSGSPTQVVKIFRPTVTRQCETHLAGDDGSIRESADRLVAFLKERQLL